MADSTTKLTPESVIQTYQRAKERRRMWESHWNEQARKVTEKQRAAAKAAQAAQTQAASKKAVL